MTVPGARLALPSTFSPPRQRAVGPRLGCTAFANATHWPVPVERPTKRVSCPALTAAEAAGAAPEACPNFPAGGALVDTAATVGAAVAAPGSVHGRTGTVKTGEADLRR